eukprot:m.340268 g.340268  ORF g.340268 m.340268 type:complete len:448 (-) comp19218_c0_seq1:55-1398(-)
MLTYRNFLPESFVPGRLYTNGRGGQGQLGHDITTSNDAPNCALPSAVMLPGDEAVVDVSFGSGQQASVACVTEKGKVYVFGNNYKSRLEPSKSTYIQKPQELRFPSDGLGEATNIHVVQASCGGMHSLYLSNAGHVYHMGGDIAKPKRLQLENITYIDCDHTISGAVSRDGSLYMWGKSPHFPFLTMEPTKVAGFGPSEEKQVALISIGSMYAAIVTTSHELFTCGYGGHGNLGHGSRRSCKSFKKVAYFSERGVEVVFVSCTRAQDGVKGGLNPKSSGNEGPHTSVLTSKGDMYTFGTAHKGVLLNLSKKTGAFNSGFDELIPYRVGDKVRNELERGHEPYDKFGPFTFCISAHIHAAAIGSSERDGKVGYAWGCGSNDGRCGVIRFLIGCNGGLDKMKCYLMAPNRVGIDNTTERVWKPNAGLEGMEVVRCASGRNTMGWICRPR